MSEAPGSDPRGLVASTAAAERLAQLRHWIAVEGHVRVRDAADRLGVTPESVRRYLARLEREGVAARIHGGAVSKAAAPDPESRPNPELRRIAAVVWSLLPRQGSVLLGAGAVSEAVATLLRDSPDDLRGLTVVTDSLPTAVTASQRDDLTVYSLGGQVNSSTRGQFGAWALSGLQRTHTDVVLSCPDGICAEHGLTRRTAQAAAIAEAELRAGRERIAAAPYAALGQASLFRYARARDCLTIITGAAGRDHSEIRSLREIGADVRLA